MPNTFKWDSLNTYIVDHPLQQNDDNDRKKNKKKLNPPTCCLLPFPSPSSSCKNTLQPGVDSIQSYLLYLIIYTVLNQDHQG